MKNQWRILRTIKKRAVSAGMAAVMAFTALGGIAVHAEPVHNMQETEDEWKMLSDRLDKIGNTWGNPSYSNSTTVHMQQTALAGNGDIGIVSSGTTTGSSREKSYLVSKGDFWSAGWYDTKETSTGNTANRTARIMPVGGVSIKPYQTDGSAMTVIEERQNITDAALTTDIQIEGEDIELYNWISATENIMITEITSNSSENVYLAASVWGYNKKIALTNMSSTASGINEDKKSVWALRNTGNWLPGHEGTWTSEAVVESKIVGSDEVSLEVTAGNSADVQFMVPAGEKIYLVTAFGGGGQTYDHNGNLNGPDPKQETADLLDNIIDENDISDLWEDHTEWWKEYWLASYLDIGDELLHEYYFGSLYYMGCTARADKMANGLYGLFVTNDNVNWAGDFHLNYNFQAPFYGMYSSNRGDLALSNMEQILEYMDRGQYYAKNKLRKLKNSYVDARPDLEDGIDDGLLYPVGIGPYGATAISNLHGQTLAVPFSATMFVSYWRYMQDEEFLLEKAYPFLEKAANFYLRWCYKEELEDGTYRYILEEDPHEDYSWGKNSSPAIGTVCNLLECLIETYDITSAAGKSTPEQYEQWLDLYNNMSDIPIRDYTAGSFSGKMFGLSEDKEINRATSASVELEFVHPGERLSFDSDPYLLEVGRDTVDAKQAASSGTWGQNNNTPKIYIQAIRLGYDPQYIIDKFKTTQLTSSKFLKNFTITDNTHGIEKAGAIEFVNNMLLMSSNGILKVFPNWTGADANYVRLREKGAFLVSAEMKNRKVQYIEIESEAGGTLELVIPWKQGIIVKDSDQNIVDYTLGKTENTQELTCKIDTEPGETYYFTAETQITEPDIKVGMEAIEDGQIINLTETGTKDWLRVFYDGGLQLTSKKDGSGIHDFTTDGTIGRVRDLAFRASWEDGYPTEAHIDSLGAGYAAGASTLGGGFTFAVDAQAYEQELRIHALTYQSIASLEVSIGDDEPIEVFLDKNDEQYKLPGSTTKAAAAFVVKFRQNEPGDILKVNLTLNSSYGSGANVALQSVTLSGEPDITEDPIITVDENIQNGYITFTPKDPSAGDIVTVKPTPFSKYILKEGSLKYNDNILSLNDSGEYTFIMPDSDVVLTARFIADMKRLDDLVNTCKDLEESEYTAESWSVLKEAMKKAEAVLLAEDSSAAEVHRVYTALLEAKIKLVIIHKVNKVYLGQLIVDAEEIDTSNVRPGLVAALEKCLAEAKRVYDSTEADQEMVDTAATNLFIAVINLKDIVSRADVDELVSLFEKLDEQEYTENSWKVLAEAIQDAQKLNDDSSQADVDEVYNNLCDAYEKLEKRQTGVNKTALKNALEDGKLIQDNIDDFIPSTVKGLKEIYDRAKAVYDDPDASQEEIDTAAAELAKANAKARVKEDKTLLERAVRQAETVNPEKYTAESYAVLAKALADSRIVLMDDEATAEEIETAYAAIRAAMSQLIENTDGNGGNPSTDDTTDQSADTNDDSKDSESSDDAGSDGSKGDRNGKKDTHKNNNGKKNNGSKVKTGDESVIVILIVLMITMTFGITGLVFYGKRRQ